MLKKTFCEANMSNLQNLLLKLPPRCQEDAVLGCLYGLLTEMRFDLLKPLLANAENLEKESPRLGMESILISLEVAIRERNEGCALENYAKLRIFESGAAARAKALDRLGIILLPAKTRLLAKLWEAELEECPSERIREELGQIGARLCKAANGNGDEALALDIRLAGEKFLGAKFARQCGAEFN